MKTKRIEKFISAAMRSDATALHRNEALVMAAGSGDSLAVERLIEEHKVNVNWIIPGERRTALHAAVIFHHAGCVKSLLNYGADPGIRDKHGKSSIDLATETGPRPLVDDSIYRLIVSKVESIASLGGAVDLIPDDWSEPATPSGQPGKQGMRIGTSSDAL